MFKQHPIYLRYYISDSGAVLDTASGRELKHHIDPYGYLRCNIVNEEGLKRPKFIHRLLAETHIPNPENKPYINHKNGQKSDNSIDNLEWCTQKENIVHAYATGLNSRGVKTYAWNVFTKESAGVFSSSRQAALALGVPMSNICRCLAGRCNQTGDYTFTNEDTVPVAIQSPKVFLLKKGEDIHWSESQDAIRKAVLGCKESYFRHRLARGITEFDGWLYEYRELARSEWNTGIRHRGKKGLRT